MAIGLHYCQTQPFCVFNIPAKADITDQAWAWWRRAERDVAMAVRRYRLLEFIWKSSRTRQSFTPSSSASAELRHAVTARPER